MTTLNNVDLFFNILQTGVPLFGFIDSENDYDLFVKSKSNKFHLDEECIDFVDRFLDNHKDEILSEIYDHHYKLELEIRHCVKVENMFNGDFDKNEDKITRSITIFQESKVLSFGHKFALFDIWIDIRQLNLKDARILFEKINWKKLKTHIMAGDCDKVEKLFGLK